ncbi:MAG: FAD:protein FMN transferase [Planctomycetota bacterium]|nr:MAG: FAD:protein FMN transferase [Planctomycetota bacterium]
MMFEDRTADHGISRTSKRFYVAAVIVFIVASAIAIAVGVSRAPDGEVEGPIRIKPKEGGPAVLFRRHPEMKNVFIIAADDMMGGVPVEITGWGLEKKELFSAFEAALNRMRGIEAKLSTYRTDSEISQINEVAGMAAVEVDKDTMRVMQKSIELCEYFAGRLDITIGPFVDLWKKCGKEDREPTQEEMGIARQFVGYGMIEISENGSTIKLLYEGMRLDLGATAKGFMVDEAAAVLKEKGLKGFLIMAGGDGYAHGVRSDGKEWRVGIAEPKPGSQGPTPGTSSYVKKLKASNVAVTTSGNYIRGPEIKGRKRSHIINPLDGQPCDSVPSVTAIAPDALTADAYATGFSVMAHDRGVKETIETAEMTDDVEILILIYKDGKLTAHQTEGFGKYLLE